MYADHIQKCNFVFVALPIISGANDINFVLSEDGMKVAINYTWPTAIFRAQELFSDEINHPNPKCRISVDHPKIHALTTHLLDFQITENTNPKGTISVLLPIRVQREVGSWTKKAVKKSDGTRIVLLEFKAYQESLIIKDADTTINFD